MKAVAEFVMRGRPQAIGVAVVAAALPFFQWLAAAVVSLVMLRQGPKEGFFVLLWAVLPMLLIYYLGGDLTSVTVLLGASVMAFVLRATVSWELTLLVSVAMGVISMFLIELLAADVFAEYVRLYRDFMIEVQQQAQAQNPSLVVEAPTFEAIKALLAGILSLGFAVSMIGIVVLGRWWQSMLYNPGGFQQEFHQIRLSPMVAGGLVVGVLLSFSLEPLNRLVQVLTVPLMIAGLALLHWTIKVKQLSTSWLVSSYLLLVILQLYPVLVFFALLDSWFNLRNKIQAEEV